jgi:tetratricopeptide (TPR) repeat protein
VLAAQGNLEEALQAYRQGLAIAERLAKADPSNTRWLRDLSASYNRVGNVLRAQGNLAEALQAYRDGLDAAERLTKADPSNTLWQHDLAVSYDKVGSVLLAQGKVAEALQSYGENLAILKRLAKADPSNAEWQRDLSVSYSNFGTVLAGRGKLAEALQWYRDSVAILERLAKIDPTNTQWQRDLRFTVWKIGGLAYKLILARDFSLALEAADQAISSAPDVIRVHTTRAYALMFLDRADEARAIYMKYRGAHNVQGDKSWEAVILEDFAEFRQAGLTHPLMDEIEKLFSGHG